LSCNSPPLFGYKILVDLKSSCLFQEKSLQETGFFGNFRGGAVLKGLSMRRRLFLFGLLLAPLALIAAPLAFADQPIVDAQMMKTILRPPTPQDEAFIDRIVKKVQRGKLPADLVDSTLDWARKKNKHRFNYFKQALILRAEQQGITLH
jgi:hypothetical protein